MVLAGLTQSDPAGGALHPGPRAVARREVRRDRLRQRGAVAPRLPRLQPVRAAREPRPSCRGRATPRAWGCCSTARAGSPRRASSRRTSLRPSGSTTRPSYFGEFQLYRNGRVGGHAPAELRRPGLRRPGHELHARRRAAMGPRSRSSSSAGRSSADWAEDWAFIAGTTGGQSRREGVVESAADVPPGVDAQPLLPARARRGRRARSRGRGRSRAASRWAGTAPSSPTAIQAIPALKQWLIHATAPPRPSAPTPWSGT